MEKIKLEIIGLSYSQSQSGAYALVLGEVDGKRRLPIIIGGFEAQAIAIELERIKPTRPLTHDLFRSFAEAFHVAIKEVIINKFVEGVFYAKLICQDAYKEKEIDSRTSDAIALALRFRCPIYTYENILAAAGIFMDEENKEEIKVQEEDKDNEFEEYTQNELEEMLKESVEKEDYERASRIRDELKRRK